MYSDVRATKPRSGSSIDLAQAVFLAEGTAEVLDDEAAVVFPEDVRLGVSDADEQDARRTPTASTGVISNAFLIHDMVLGILRPARGARRETVYVQPLTVDTAPS